MLSAFLCAFTLAIIPAEAPCPIADPVVAGIPILITRGDTIVKIGELPDVLKAAAPPNLAVGFKYSYFGVFWLDLWTWGGEYCVFEGQGFQSLTPEDCAKILNMEVGQLPKPLAYRFPYGLLAAGGLVIVLVILGRIASAKEKKERLRIQALFDDSRYQGAFEIFNKNLTPLPIAEVRAPDAESPVDETDGAETLPSELPLEQQQQSVREAIQAAVEHLVQNGEDRNVAEANFTTMLAVISQANQNAAT